VAMSRKMHLGLFINPTGHHQASWRHPGSEPDAGISFDHYRRVAQSAERACFDMVFLADNQVVRGGAPESRKRVAQYIANFEPFTILSALAAVTERIGLTCTASTSYNFPFQVARKFASLDHISGGRTGWNMVTSGPDEAVNFGGADPHSHDDRYRRADEFVEVCKGLWDSWEDDAFPRDVESGVFSDLDKLHPLDHDGEFMRVKGPLNVPRMPQGYPVLVQAGQSEAGKAFAAKHAEIMFTTLLLIERARELRAEMKERIAENGRDRDSIKIMPGFAIVTGPTHEAAHERFEELQSLLHPQVALNILSQKMGRLDLSRFPLDEPLPPDALPDGYQGGVGRSWMEISQRENLTLLQLALRASGSLAGLQVVGSYEEVADLMEEWFRTEACDGFNIQPAYFPGMLDDFVEGVIPILRGRSLVRERYQGQTLREHFGLQRPEWGAHRQRLSSQLP
jgi:FMN-dependent oxidoreductase (nitrilotriacetate monooxygenase family)